MRPDQHKQKRSTQYKKKHGINDKPKNEENSNKNNKKEKGHSSGQPSTQWQLPQQKKTKSDEENASSAEDDNVKPSSFRRRKIESNWDRYRSLPADDEDENPSEIGTDFSKLLQQTADALSQFRFKDEKDWEEDKTFLSSNFLALDCDALAKSLQCLPLHERLGLNIALFTDEQLEEFSAEAERSRTLYNPGSCSTIVQEQQTALDISAMHSVLSAAMHLVPALLKTVKPEAAHSENDSETELVKEDNELVVEKEAVIPGNEDLPISDSVKKSNSKSGKKKKSAPVEPKVTLEPVSQEDELDMLLSLGNTKSQPDIREASKAEKSVEIAAPVEKKYVSSATASLEDWLDSVLDS